MSVALYLAFFCVFSKSVFIQNSCLFTITCHYHMLIVVCMLIASSLLLAPTAPPALPVSPCATLALPLWVTSRWLGVVCQARCYSAWCVHIDHLVHFRSLCVLLTCNQVASLKVLRCLNHWLSVFFPGCMHASVFCFFGGDELCLFQFTVVLHRKVEMGSLPSCW